jgi:hypothetical protein
MDADAVNSALEALRRSGGSVWLVGQFAKLPQD